MARTRVLVVDDSVVIRKLVSDVLGSDPDIEVVGTAVNGRIALHKIEQLRPDLVTMDIEMPEMDGITAVRELRRTGSRIPVIMFSTLTEQGASATLEALSAGATDYVTKPANVGSVTQSLEQVRSALIPRIKALVPQSPTSFAPPRTHTLGRGPGHTEAHVGASSRASTGSLNGGPAGGSALTRPRTSSPVGAYRLLVIGCSTGGPEALRAVLTSLPRLPVPVAVVQHMPPVFTRQFAMRLDRQVGYSVVEAEQGMPMEAGTVHIAPGDHHLRLRPRAGGWTVALDRGPAENFCRPAVDVLFQSAADHVGSGTLAVVLTGMGHDGCLGAEALTKRGGSVLVQDQATSVVWGMPGAIAATGNAEEVLPLREIAPAIMRRLVGTSRPLAPAAREARP